MGRLSAIRIVFCFVLLALAGCVSAAVEGAHIAKDKATYHNNIEAARAGNPEAQFRVGRALCCSLGDRQGFYDTRQAVVWLCRSSAQGYGPASQKLGQIYSGRVVEGVRLLRRVGERISNRPEDLPVAYAWLRVASRQGADGADADAGSLWSNLTDREKTRAQRLVIGSERLPCRWDEVFTK